MFCYENQLSFPIYVSDQKLENSFLLLETNENKSHYMYIKDLCLTKQRIKTKNTFVRVVCSVLVVKISWQSIKKFVWALMVHNP